MSKAYDIYNLSNLVTHRLERAALTLEEAMFCVNQGLYNFAVNRLFFACFYAASTLFLKENGTQSCKTPSEISRQLMKDEPQYGAMFQKLAEYRHSADYEDFYECDGHLFKHLYPSAEQLVKHFSNITMQRLSALRKASK